MHQKIYKILEIPKFFLVFFIFRGCWAVGNFVIFHSMKVAKHICDPCCHLTAETGKLMHPYGGIAHAHRHLRNVDWSVAQTDSHVCICCKKWQLLPLQNTSMMQRQPAPLLTLAKTWTISSEQSFFLRCLCLILVCASPVFWICLHWFFLSS